MGRTFGDVIERAPGAFIDGSGNVSIGGATGLENQYTINGMNVTGLRYGSLEMGLSSRTGGTNLPPEFLSQIDVNSGGYQAEYGGAMGGVINTVLKSGTNEWHGSAFGYWSPYWLAGDPKVVLPRGSSLGGVRKPDFDDSIGVEAGGPLHQGQAVPVGRLRAAHHRHPRPAGDVRASERRDGHAGAGRVRQPGADPAALHRAARRDAPHVLHGGHRGLGPAAGQPPRRVAILATPSFNTQLKNQFGVDPFSSDPRTAMESLTRTNTDVTAHWVSKLYERKWQIDALAGMHYEYSYDRSPYDDLNNLNQLQIGGADLWSVERAPGCQPQGAFIPCPIAPYYYAGGIGEIDKSDAYRWSAEIKSTQRVRRRRPARAEVRLAPGLRHDGLHAGVHAARSGARGFISLPGDGTYSAQNFFQLPNTESPVQYNTGMLNADAADDAALLRRHAARPT